MTLKLQRNPSTLKLMRDAATGKLMRAKGYEIPGGIGSDCEFCEVGKTPKYLSIMMENLVTCVSCKADGGYYGHKFVGVAEAINGNTYILEQDVAEYCVWKSGDISGDFGTLELFWYDDCSTPPAGNLIYFTELSITISLGLTIDENPGIYIDVSVLASVNPPDYYRHHVYRYMAWDIYGMARPLEAAITKCATVTDLSNIIVDCQYSRPGYVKDPAACVNGVASVVDGDVTL